MDRDARRLYSLGLVLMLFGVAMSIAALLLYVDG